MQSNNSNNSRQLLMREIQIYSFALKDIQLYLDTHPNCMKALAFFKKYKARWNINNPASLDFLNNLFFGNVSTLLLYTRFRIPL